MKKYCEEWKRYNYLTCEIDSFYHAVAVKQGLSDSAMRILYTICEQGDGCKQSVIYKLAAISRQTVNTAIHKLEREDIIFLEAGEGRNTRVHLTEKGKMLVEEKIRPLLDAENEVLENWPEEERQELIRLTKKYLDDFKARAEHMVQSLDVRIGETR